MTSRAAEGCRSQGGVAAIVAAAGIEIRDDWDKAQPRARHACLPISHWLTEPRGWCLPETSFQLPRPQLVKFGMSLK